MAATYQYLPLSIRDIFYELVAIVSDNLSTDDDLDISQVSFKCETWIELIKRISSEDNSTNHRATKYPLIAVIRNFDEKYSKDSNRYEVTLTIVIVTPSDPNKLSEDREADNYVPILRPIYAELMEAIKADNRFFGYYRLYPPHTKTESFQLGTDSPHGNKAYLLPDCVDGIIISDLTLEVYQDNCLPTIVGANVITVYLNNVSDLSVVLTDTLITVTLESAGYIDTLGVGFGEAPVYYITHDNTDTPEIISVSGHVGISTYDVPDGFYKGYIYCNDGVTNSKLFFYYRVVGSRFVGCTAQTKMLLTNFTTGGEYYENYPFDVVLRQRDNPGSLIAQQILSTDGGNFQWERIYQPSVSDTSTNTVTITKPLTTTYSDVSDEVAIGNSDIYLNSISYYKQQ